MFEWSTAALYSLKMEFSQGVLKRSNLALLVHNLPILKFSLFSSGLESLVTDGVSTDEDLPSQIAPSAGMQLEFFGAKQLPVTFFEGQSQLMSSILSADGRPHTAYKGYFLTHDYNFVVPFSNGQILHAKLMAAVSLKMTGSIEVSIWYRSSKTNVETNGESAFSGIHSIYEGDYFAEPIHIGKFSLTAGSVINFKTDVDFYEMPFKMCMRMDAPKSSIRQAFATNQTKIKRKRTLEGRSFVTHPIVSQKCTEYQEHF